MPAVFRSLVLSSTTQPLSQPVAGEAPETYLRQIGWARAWRRAAWRRVAFLLSGQNRLRLDRIPTSSRRVLWSYFGENQIGDALMDLAARSLLVESGIAVDLWTSPAIAALFERDPWFGKVGSEASAFAEIPYDCVLVLSNKNRPLAPKRASFPRLPWVSLQESFTGPNFHRGAFAAQRIADLLGARLTPTELDRHALQKLGPIEAGNRALHADMQGGIALAVGGVRGDRVYPHWAAVMRQLAEAGHLRIALVGAANGSDQARHLVASTQGVALVTDFTGQLTLGQVRSVLNASAVVACADGGLMHLALTTRAPVVALFTAQIAPEWRLPAGSHVQTLRTAEGRVGAIDPLAVSEAIVRVLAATPPSSDAAP